VSVTLYTSLLTVNEGGSATEFQTHIRLHAPATLAPGSSVSHWSADASPNLLMEPSINSGLNENLDLSPLLMKDIGWDTRDIAIPHLTYELWLNDYGLALTDLNAAPSDDLDNDGILNLLEYHQNLNPLQASPSSLSFVNSTLSLRRYLLPNDLEHTYETSINLSEWEAINLTESNTLIDAQTQDVTSPISIDNEKRFYRYRVEISE
jgi:hypothetical protein